MAALVPTHPFLETPTIADDDGETESDGESEGGASGAAGDDNETQKKAQKGKASKAKSKEASGRAGRKTKSKRPGQGQKGKQRPDNVQTRGEYPVPEHYVYATTSANSTLFAEPTRRSERIPGRKNAQAAATSDDFQDVFDGGVSDSDLSVFSE